MYLELSPATPLDGRMLTLSGHRMTLDRDRGTLRAGITKRDGLIDFFYPGPDGPRPLLTNRDERHVADKGLTLEYRLSEKGAAFLADAVGQLGPLDAAIYEDAQDPFALPPVDQITLPLTAGYALPIGRRITLFPS